MQVMTVLEAEVAAERVGALETAYRDAITQLDAGIERTFLARDAKNPHVWRIITLWASREALVAMRQSGETPKGVLMFRAAGAEPTLTILDVVQSA